MSLREVIFQDLFSKLTTTTAQDLKVIYEKL